MSGRRRLIKGYLSVLYGRGCGHVFGLLRGERASVRRIKLAMASSFPNQREFRIAHVRLAAAAR